MTSKAALFALLALWGVGSSVALPAHAEEMTSTDSQSDDDDDSAEGALTNRVWVKDEAGGLPSVIRIFLSDGTLVQDSCWETHRLSLWQMVSDKSLSWDEDGVEIKADVVSITATDLVLSLNLKGGAVEERYVTATAPYVCPDLPKT